MKLILTSTRIVVPVLWDVEQAVVRAGHRVPSILGLCSILHAFLGPHTGGIAPRLRDSRGVRTLYSLYNVVVVGLGD